MIIVPPLWTDPRNLTADQKLEVYATCERGKASRCINTNLAKLTAKVTGRVVRKINTLNGYQNWSEYITDAGWHMFCQPLTLEYALKIDAFDRGVHFKLPRKCPLGPVEYKGPCEERRDPIEVIRRRKAAYYRRVAEGKVIPRQKFREPQAPAVAARRQHDD